MAKVAGQKVRYGQINHEYGLKLATTPPEEDGPIWMVNLMKYREKADYADGRSADISGREADDLYAPLGPLKAIGAQVVFLAEVDAKYGGLSGYVSSIDVPQGTVLALQARLLD